MEFLAFLNFVSCVCVFIAFSCFAAFLSCSRYCQSSLCYELVFTVALYFFSMVTSQLSQITDAAGITTSGGTVTRVDDDEFEETMERKQLEV